MVRCAASLSLEWLAVDMQRMNAVPQPAGSSVCGCFCLRWMEQAVGSRILKEAWCSAGWPEAGAWAERIYKLTGALKKGQAKRLNEALDASEKAVKVMQKKQLADEKKAALKKHEGDLKDLAGVAKAGLEKIPAGKPCFENLSSEAQAAVLEAASHVGACSKCRFTSGCLKCVREKAPQYWLKREGFLKETVEDALKQKAAMQAKKDAAVEAKKNADKKTEEDAL